MFGRSVFNLIVYSIHVCCMHAIRLGWLSCHFILVVLYFHYSLISYYRICMFRSLVLWHGNGPMAIRVVLVLYTIAQGDMNVILHCNHGAWVGKYSWMLVCPIVVRGCRWVVIALPVLCNPLHPGIT